MGLLDDAIREHLELKRRHGADADEVQALEREALGPVGRPEPLAVPAEPVADPEPVADAEPVAEPVAESGGSVRLEDFAAEEERAYEQTVAEDPDVLAESEETHRVAVEEERSYERGLSADPSQETVAFDALRDAPAEDAPADELAETPEFLQETPEHDRLWFEQKPPRDFDF